MTLWLIRTSLEQEQVAYDKDVITMRWNSLPDLTGISKEALTQAYEKVYLEPADRGRAQRIGQIWNFLYSIQIGDVIVTPLKLRQYIAVGLVIGEYEYRGYLICARHTRKVKWLGVIPRSEMSQDVLNSMGSMLAICKIKKNDAEHILLELTLKKPYLIDTVTVTPSLHESL